jgi:hypothetical protein
MILVILNTIFAIVNIYFALTIPAPYCFTSILIALLNISAAYIIYREVCKSKD